MSNGYVGPGGPSGAAESSRAFLPSWASRVAIGLLGAVLGGVFFWALPELICLGKKVEALEARDRGTERQLELLRAELREMRQDQREALRALGLAAKKGN